MKNITDCKLYVTISKYSHVKVTLLLAEYFYKIIE